MTWAYYNEFDPAAAEWLRELMKAGLIAPGDVDERSILDVEPVDLIGYTQCHFFAGIGGWSYALRRAGWPDDRPVWTGSPPCQPFSVAGRGDGQSDERHLAPHFVGLVRGGRPAVLFGEQVASSAVFGKVTSAAQRAAAGAPEWAWFDDLSDRLEAAHYAVGASDIPAAGVDAPHIRQRTFFGAVRLADSNGPGPLPGAQRGIHRGEESARLRDGEPERPGTNGGVEQRFHPQNRSVDGSGHSRPRTDAAGGLPQPSPLNGFWRDADWLFCRDGKWRPVEPGTFPLADGIPGRVGLLRGYGNAICPEPAEAFIRAFGDCINA